MTPSVQTEQAGNSALHLGRQLVLVFGGILADLLFCFYSPDRTSARDISHGPNTQFPTRPGPECDTARGQAAAGISSARFS